MNTKMQFLAGGAGFEPTLTESESAVLPLDDPPVTRSSPNVRRGFYPSSSAGSSRLIVKYGLSVGAWRSFWTDLSFVALLARRDVRYLAQDAKKHRQQKGIGRGIRGHTGSGAGR